MRRPTTEPLGLTRGSIRAVLAIVLVMGVIAGGIGFVAAGLLDAREVFVGFVGLAGPVVQMYFHSRPTTPAPLNVTLGEPKEASHG